LLVSVAAAAQNASPEIAAKADALINAYVKQGKFSGSVLIAKGGTILLNKGYGMANYELDVPNTPQTKFRLGSVTKQFTAMLIAQLAERGQLNVEDPVTKYLPDYPKETGDKVKIYNLLTHSSGVPNFTSFPEYATAKMKANKTAEIVALFKDKPLEFAPGEKFKYSNSGYVLLAYLIEKITGKTYEQVLKENIFEPLGMKNTGYDHNNQILKNRASGYSIEGNKIENADYINMTIPSGAGALYSTVEDLYLWDRALYTEKLVKKAMLEKIFTPYKSGYAYGWGVDEQFGHKRISHNGGIDGFNTNVIRFPNDDVFIVGLSNFIPSAVSAMTQKLAAVVFNQPYELPQDEKTVPARKEITIDPKILDAYVGQYELRPDFIITVTKEGDKLMAQATGQQKLPLFPESETKFFMKVVDAQVAFVKTENGAVGKMILYQNGNEAQAKKIK
jgi:CubicO group peptidase (beta-lactamase class C family)